MTELNPVEMFQEFNREVGTSWQSETFEKQDQIRSSLAENNLENFEEGDLRQLVRNLWAYDRWGDKDYVIERIVQRDISAVRDTLQHALYDTADTGARFSELKELNNVGTATASEILMFIYPDEYALCDTKAIEGLKELGFGTQLPNDSHRIRSSEDYLAFLEAAEKLRFELAQQVEDPSSPLNFIYLNEFLYYLAERDQAREAVEDFDHEEMKEELLAIGDGLGFDVQEEYKAGPRAVIDVLWSTRVANLGKISYAFEVHRSGSPDSAILNLQKTKNTDPTIQKVVIVATKKDLDRFREELEAVGGDFSKSVSYLEPSAVEQANSHLTELQEILKKAELLEAF